MVRESYADVSVMTVDEIRRRKATKGWSSRRFQIELDVPKAAAARIERSGPAGREEQLLVLSVLGRCGEEESPHGDGCVVRSCSCECHLPEGDDGEVSATHWRGLTAGSTCRITGPKGGKIATRYTFIRYYRNPAQEYVELRGPRGETRTVRPGDVRDVNGRELTGAPIG